jgi:hypothetical protein
LSEKKKKWYDTRDYEPMSSHVWFLFIAVSALALDIQRYSLIDSFRTNVLCLYFFIFPCIVAFVDFYQMCHRRQTVEAYYDYFKTVFWEIEK